MQLASSARDVHIASGSPGPRVVAIDDPADERVADYVGLTDAELRRRVEAPGPATSRSAHAGIFIAEGLHVIGRLLRSPYRVRSFLVIPRRLDALAGILAGAGAAVPGTSRPPCSSRPPR